MKTYNEALQTAVDATVNMPNPETHPAKFIEWAEDICILISEIYAVDYEQVTEDLKEYIGLYEDE